MKRFEPYVFLKELASRWDVLAFIVVIGLIAFLGETARGLFVPLSRLEISPLSLDPRHLPEYAARTTFRMLAALFCSLLFTLTYATWAAKSERAGKILVPVLDILQSVPILGFHFRSRSSSSCRLFPGACSAPSSPPSSPSSPARHGTWRSASISPAHRAGRSGRGGRMFRLSPWQRFWQLEVPFAMPALVWNMMMSMSGGWFFVVASEAISVGNTTVALPGMGSYIAVAIEQQEPRAPSAGRSSPC